MNELYLVTSFFVITVFVAFSFHSAHAQSETDQDSLTSKYSHLDPQHMVPPVLLRHAVAFYERYLSEIKNPDYLTIVDFSKPSNLPRFFVINMRTGGVWALRVAHGEGSDPANSGYAKLFGNNENSDRSSLGVYLTSETYEGKHGFSLRLDGLSKTNSQARAREIVIHGASYVKNANVREGRSSGCFALAMESRAAVIEEIRDGSLIYAGRSAQNQ